MFPDFVKPGEPIKASWANDVVTTLRSIRKPKSKRTTSTFTSSPVCPFGKLVTTDAVREVLGGIVYCGDKNFIVPNHPLNLLVDSDVLLYFEIPCESNRDDDNEIILPGIKTSSWVPAWESGATYADNTNPTAATGIGTIIIPIGQVVISGGGAKFTPVSCGNIFVSQCAGTLSHSRA